MDNLETTPINLNAPQQEQDPINLTDDQRNKPQVTPLVASQRAAKAAFGLSNTTGHSYDDAHKAISGGDEDNFRIDAAARVDQSKKLQFVQGQLPAQALLQRTNPNSVIEQYFAKQYVAPTYDASKPFIADSVMGTAMKEIPKQVSDTANIGSDMIAKREMLLTRAQNLEAAYEEQSAFERYTQSAFNMLPLTGQAITRGQVPGQEEYKILPGEDTAEQSKAFYRLPMDEAQATLDRLEQSMGKLNPSLAADFFRRLAGMSTDDRVLNDQLGLIDITTIAAPSAALARRIGQFNHVRQATQDVVKSTEKVGGAHEPDLSPDIADWESEGGAGAREPIKVTAAAATGDLQEAAVLKSADNLVKGLQGKSITQKQSLDALLSEQRADVAGIKAAARPDEQEIVNRIEQDYISDQTNVIKSVETSMKVNRTPILETSEDVMRAVEAKVKENFRGANNKVLDVDTKPDVFTNSYNHEIKLGNEDGTPFETREIAEGNARLNGYIIKPLEDVSDARKVKLREMISDAHRRLLEAPTEAASALESEGGTDPTSRLEANLEAWQKELNAGPSEGHEIVQQGNGYVIVYIKPVDEFVVNHIVVDPPKTNIKADLSLWQRSRDWWTTSREDKNLLPGETPYLRDQGVLNSIRAHIGWIRTPEETLPRDLREQMKIGTHGVSKMREPAIKTFKQVNQVPARLWNAFNRILKEAQNIPDPENGGIPGYFFKNITELNNQYLNTLKRLPEESEIRAYFAFRRNQDYDLYNRRLALYIPKASRAAEQHNISVKVLDGKKIESGFFDGITHPGLPIGEDNVFVVGDRVYKGNQIPSKIRKLIDDQSKSGQVKIVEAIDPDERPFKNFDEVGDNTVRYAVIPGGSSQTKPLSLLGQLPRRGGGHLVPEYEHYGKQAVIRRVRSGNSYQDRYVDDATLMPFADRVTGREIIGKLNAIREKLHTEGVAAAKEEHASQKFPIDWKEVRSWFAESRTATGEKVPPKFSTKEPFHMVKTNETINEIDKDGLHARYPKTYTDGTKQGSIARTFKVEFSGARDARDLKTINDVGGRDKPVYKYEPAKVIDPITAQNRGLARIINSNMMNDVKNLAVTKWLKDAQQYVDAKPSEIWHSPFHYFNEAKFLKTTPYAIRSVLRGNRLKIQNFLGSQSVVDNVLHETSQYLADAIHGAAGPRLVPSNLLSRVSDPTAFMRTVSSHAVLGLGSVKQFFTQFTTHTNIQGMSPRSAPAGAMATLLHGWSVVNNHPNIIADMDRRASQLSIPGMSSFKPGQFTEAHDLITRSGFVTVAEEHALAANNPAAAKLIKSAGVTLLDWGMTPFKLGAESVRSSAGYTAYLEFREASPTGRMTRADEARWLDRASILDHNMARYANSVLHSGILSTPGQFFAYDLRLAEIMWGKRIAPIDKARLFATSAIMYGIPLGGFGLSGVPLYKYVRKQMESQHGYVVGDDAFVSLAMEGLPALIGASISSHEGLNPKFGNWYDFSKFGAKGADYLDDLNSDVSFWKILGGVSASVFFNAARNTSNLRAALLPHLMGGVDGFKFKVEDMTDAFKTFASYDQAWKFKAAYNTGTWISNNGQVVDDSVSAWDAGFMALTGTQHVEYLDQYIKQEQIRDSRNFELKIMGQAKENFDRYLRSEADGDPEQAQDYKTRAIAILLGPGGFPSERLPEAFASFLKGQESVVKEIDKRFYTGNQVPDADVQQMLEAWKATVRRREGQGKD